MIGRQLAGRVLGVCAMLVLWLATSAAHAAADPKPEWTVMVYMNGDNDLEKFAVADFLEMAEVGSTDQVNIIVQFDRRSKKDYRIGHRRVAPGWTETLRFRVEKGMKPLLANALNRESAAELDMGDSEVLREFVQWAANNYPADQFALVIWDHGDGFRAVQPEVPGVEPRQERVYRSLEDAAHRAVSHDESNGNVLYNHEVQSALRAALREKHLAVLGFDACLMGMIEVAFAMRGFADVLVASEELVPGTGWDYADWLRPLVQSPAEYGPEELGKLLVASFERTYKERNGTTTHSAVRLAAVEGLADAVSALGDRLRENLAAELDAVREARGACAIYAPNTDCKGRPCYQNIDLGRFCSELARRSSHPAILEAANRVVQLLQAAVLANYAGLERGGQWGSTGLAIYFPPDRTTYEQDGVRKEGYDKSNTAYPVEFVQRHHWADFLHAFFRKVN
jgi:hypothetical protein